MLFVLYTREPGFKKRQVFDVNIIRLVAKYRAEILLDHQVYRNVVPLPEAVKSSVQYSLANKADAV